MCLYKQTCRKCGQMGRSAQAFLKNNLLAGSFLVIYENESKFKEKYKKEAYSITFISQI